MERIWNPFETQGAPQRTLRIPIGRIAITAAVLALIEDAHVDIAPYILRHITGDWGELDAEDRAANNRALATGDRILSRYETGAASFGLSPRPDTENRPCCCPRSTKRCSLSPPTKRRRCIAYGGTK